MTLGARDTAEEKDAPALARTMSRPLERLGQLPMIAQDHTKQTSTLEESLKVLQGLVASCINGPDDNATVTLEYIQELQQKLSSDDFYLAILGLFKRGKSTLINALLGSNVLPSGVIPVTSVITKIRYGDRESARISFSDGSVREISTAELSEYITEKGNPRNEKGVLQAEVRSPSMLCKSGVTIIDTPGVGSTYPSGTEATYTFLEKVDASLFVLAVDPPISQEELDLLKAAKRYAKKFTFVLNKKDYVDRVRLNEAVDFCRDVIEPSLGLQNVKIYPTSARLALEGCLGLDAAKIADSGITELKAALDELFYSKHEILAASTAGKALKLADGISMSQEIAIKSAAMPLSELEQTIVQIDNFLKSVESRKREIFYLLDGKSKEIVQVLDEDIERFKKERISGFEAALESYANQLLESSMNPRQITTEVEEKLKETLIETYSDLVSSEDVKLETGFRELVNAFNKQMDLLLGDVRQMVSSLFGIKMEASPSASLTSEHRFYYRIDHLFRADPMFIEQIPLLLPKSLFKGSLLKKVKALANEEFERTAGRMRYEYFMVRLDKGILDLKRDLGQSLDSSILAARNAAVQGTKIRQKSREEVEKRLGELKGTLEAVQSVRNHLEELLRSQSIDLVAPPSQQPR